MIIIIIKDVINLIMIFMMFLLPYRKQKGDIPQNVTADILLSQQYAAIFMSRKGEVFSLNIVYVFWNERC